MNFSHPLLNISIKPHTPAIEVSAKSMQQKLHGFHRSLCEGWDLPNRESNWVGPAAFELEAPHGILLQVKSRRGLWIDEVSSPENGESSKIVPMSVIDEAIIQFTNRRGRKQPLDLPRSVRSEYLYKLFHYIHQHDLIPLSVVSTANYTAATDKRCMTVACIGSAPEHSYRNAEGVEQTWVQRIECQYSFSSTY